MGGNKPCLFNWIGREQLLRKWLGPTPFIIFRSLCSSLGWGMGETRPSCLGELGKWCSFRAPIWKYISEQRQEDWVMRVQHLLFCLLLLMYSVFYPARASCAPGWRSAIELHPSISKRRGTPVGSKCMEGSGESRQWPRSIMTDHGALWMVALVTLV